MNDAKAAHPSSILALVVSLALLAACTHNDYPWHNDACLKWKPIPTCALTPAPPGESLLARYKRTEADYQRCEQLKDDFNDSYETPDTLPIVMPAYEARESAKQAILSAKCGTICQPQDSQ